MKIEEQHKFVDDNGDWIDEIVLSNSRFDRMAIKRSKDDIVVRAKGGDNTYQFDFGVAEVVLQGVVPSGRRRRDIDDDIQDALLAAGFGVTDFGQEVIQLEQ
jgi:hypothetical protein